MRPTFRYTMTQSHRYNEGILTVILRKPDGRVLRLNMDCDLQFSTHYNLKVLEPPTASETVFYFLKEKLEKDNPGLNLQPADLDVMAIARYIEHQLGLWETNFQFEPGVRWRVNEKYGICIMVRQASGTVCVNTNEQRYIHQTDMSDEDMCESLAFMQIGYCRPVKIEVDTVRRLREIIRKNLQQRPRGQSDHWMKVNTPYLEGELPTIEHGPIYNASGSVTGFCR